MFTRFGCLDLVELNRPFSCSSPKVFEQAHHPVPEILVPSEHNHCKTSKTACQLIYMPEYGDTSSLAFCAHLHLVLFTCILSDLSPPTILTLALHTPLCSSCLLSPAHDLPYSSYPLCLHAYLHLLMSFALLCTLCTQYHPLCPFTPTYCHLFNIHFMSIFDQTVQYYQYIDNFSTYLLATFTTDVIFLRW